MTKNATAIAYDRLIEERRIHADLYTSNEVFQEELEKIWYRGWVFVAHTSELPNAGDYRLRRIGLESVIVTRDRAGQISVLVNRCAHRGNQVCNAEKGKLRALTCPYHGWTYGLDGQLLDTPHASGYTPDFDKSKNGLYRAQVEIYRGFVFARLAPEGITLAEHLGKARDLIDQACDMSPVGELDLTAGWMKHRFKSNWKMLPENDTDGYHVEFAHSAFMRVTGTQVTDYVGEHVRPAVRDWGGGHTEIDFARGYRDTGKLFEWFGRVPEAKLAKYVAAMERAYGKEKGRARLIDGPPHAIIFPNLFLAEQNIVFYYPVSVDECVQLYTPMLLKGDPEEVGEVNRRALRQCEGAVGPASFLIPEDAAIAERNQIGLMSRAAQWLDLSRGMHRERRDERGMPVSELSDETSNRGFWRHYEAVMSGG